jgi:hypothetical protein
MTTKRLEKTSPKFFCEKCDFKCFTNTDWNRHIARAKHIKTTNNNDINLENFKPKYVCVNCEKEYNDRAGLWRHKKKCPKEVSETNKEVDISDKNLIITLIQQNQELQKQNNEIQKQMLEVIKNGTNNTNINNSNNKTFNLQFFLNETCKDAMNITDFVNSIKLQLTDLENVGKNGYVNGISNLIVKNLNALEVNKRPVHCSDLKREIMYVKDENRWEKEKEKEKLENAIKKVSYKNVLKILEWQKEHPGCEYSCNKENDKYLQIVNESMGALTEEEKMKNINKIITRIAKEVVIEKET